MRYQFRAFVNGKMIYPAPQSRHTSAAIFKMTDSPMLSTNVSGYYQGDILEVKLYEWEETLDFDKVLKYKFVTQLQFNGCEFILIGGVPYYMTFSKLVEDYFQFGLAEMKVIGNCHQNLELLCPKETRSTDIYLCGCENCGWQGSSESLHGGSQIADTGDYGDAYCPCCGGTDIYDINED